MKETSRYCCEDHIDRAFDDLLAEFEVFPLMNESAGETCSYCSSKAEYILKVTVVEH